MYVEPCGRNKSLTSVLYITLCVVPRHVIQALSDGRLGFASTQVKQDIIPGTWVRFWLLILTCRSDNFSWVRQNSPLCGPRDLNCIAPLAAGARVLLPAVSMRCCLSSNQWGARHDSM